MEEEDDLFSQPELIPENIQEIFDRYYEQYGEEMEYSDTERMQKEVEAEGYTFDFDLDNVPYNLRKTFAKGGGVGDISEWNEKSFLLFAQIEIGGFIVDKINAPLNSDWSFEYGQHDYTIEPLIHYKKGSKTKLISASFIITEDSGRKVGEIDFIPEGFSNGKYFVASSELWGWSGERFKKGGEIKNTKQSSMTDKEKEKLTRISRLLDNNQVNDPELKAKLQAERDMLEEKVGKVTSAPKPSMTDKDKEKLTRISRLLDNNQVNDPELKAKLQAERNALEGKSGKPTSEKKSTPAPKAKKAAAPKAAAPAPKAKKSGETVMEYAKRTKKEGEKWQDALKRASKEVKNGGKPVAKKIKKAAAKAKPVVKKFKKPATKKVVAKVAPKTIKKSATKKKATTTAARVIKRSNHLNGSSNKTRDKQQRALHAGKRVSKTGNIYYEYRRNRADLNRTKKLAKGGGVGKKAKKIARPKSKRDTAKDKTIKALHAGKRTTDWGTTYVENRVNRSDKNRTKKFAKGGVVNGEYLASISEEKKNKILRNIANHYGVSLSEAEEEVKDADAEMLYEYITNESLRMEVYKDLKNK